MATSVLDSSKITSMANNNNEMVLIWTKLDYNYDLESANNKDITWITIESKTIEKKFFSGRNLENLIAKLEKDSNSLTLWISNLPTCKFSNCIRK